MDQWWALELHRRARPPGRLRRCPRQCPGAARTEEIGALVPRINEKNSVGLSRFCRARPAGCVTATALRARPPNSGARRRAIGLLPGCWAFTLSPCRRPRLDRLGVPEEVALAELDPEPVE